MGLQPVTWILILVVIVGLLWLAKHNNEGFQDEVTLTTTQTKQGAMGDGVPQPCPLKLLQKKKQGSKWVLKLHLKGQKKPEPMKVFSSEDELTQFWDFLVKNNPKLAQCAGLDLDTAIQITNSENAVKNRFFNKFPQTLQFFRVLNYHVRGKLSGKKLVHGWLVPKVLREIGPTLTGFQSRPLADAYKKGITKHDLVAFHNSYAKFARRWNKQLSKKQLTEAGDTKQMYIQAIQDNLSEYDKLNKLSRKKINEMLMQMLSDVRSEMSVGIQLRSNVVLGAPGQKIAQKAKKDAAGIDMEKHPGTATKILNDQVKQHEKDRQQLHQLLKQSRREDRDMLRQLSTKIEENGRKLAHQQEQLKQLKQNKLTKNIQHATDGSKLRDNLIDNPMQEDGILGEMVSRGRPPVCIPQKKCAVCPVQTSAKGLPTGSAADLTKVGSILPKFKYQKVYNAQHY